MKYGPALLALAAVLAAGAIATLRREPAAVPAPARPTVPASSSEAPASDPGPAPLAATPPPAKKIPRGGLRVTLAGSEASIDGRILVLDDRLSREADRDAKGGSRVQVLIEKLTTGPKTLVYIPDGAPYGTATASARVEVGSVVEVQLDLQKAAGALSGVAVDTLQQPLAGVTLTVLLPPVFPSSTPGSPERPVWSRTANFSGGRGRTMVTESAALLADGRVSRSTSSNDAGEFEMTGLGAGALTLEVAYKDLRFTQACVVGGENRIVVPVVFETPLPNLEELDFQRRIHELLRQMSLHQDAPEPYAAQLRELLQRKVDAAPITAQERALLQTHIDAIGKPAVGR